MRLRRAIDALVIAALTIGAAPPSTRTPAPFARAGMGFAPQDKDERGLWFEMDEEERQLKTSQFVIRDPALSAYVRGVFCRVAGPDCAAMRLYIVRTPYFNASAAPNGMIQVWSGLFLRVRNEAQLAAVLGHEYVHYRDRHMIQIWRDMKSKTASATFLSLFGLVGGLVAMGQLTSVYSYSRDFEAAADSGSIGLLVAAGYDPMAASQIWGQIRDEADATAAARGTKSRKDKNGGMFATHPPTAERMAALKVLAEQARVAGTPTLGRADYRAALAPLWPSFIDDQIKLNDFGATEYLIGQLAAEGWTTDLVYARAELYRARGRPSDLKQAILFYRQATADPEAPAEAWRGLGLSLLRAGEKAEGQAALRDYLLRRPDASDRVMIAALVGG